LKNKPGGKTELELPTALLTLLPPAEHDKEFADEAMIIL